MKPRLKLSTAGTLTLLAEGVTGLSQHETRRLIWKHHGTLAAFSKRFGLRYDLVCISTGSVKTITTTGKIAEVRGLLGLPTRQTKRPRKRRLTAQEARA